MIPDWETNAVVFAASLPKEFPAVWDRLETALARHAVRPLLVEGMNDIWARDILPVQVDHGRFVKFRFSPAYLRGFEHLITGDDICQRLPCLGRVQFAGIRLDGGNLVASRRLAVLTERAYRDNAKWRRADFRRALCELLAVEECLLIPVEPGDLFGHADGVLRFLDEGTVVVNDYARAAPGYGRRLHAALARAGLRVEVLPYAPDPTVEDGVPSCVGNFVNYLRVGSLVLIPAYGRREDEQARKRLQDLLPTCTVVPVKCADLARRGGALHCVSWSVRLTTDSR
ncbi:MAG: agmatine deiminase family protein [Gemmataceae bacterium]|nr:agmatine deiminase family protein [Gemmataceae bacterium]